MAVDMIARMLAMENGGGGGTGDAYTKAETDALLSDKQDALTTMQQNAVDSGITTEKVQQYDIDSAVLVGQIDNGAKNKLDIFNDAEGMTPTITRTINDDSTVTVSNSGENTSAANLRYVIHLTSNVSYVISGCPSGGGNSTYGLAIRTLAGSEISGSADYGSGSGTFTVPTSGDYLVYIRIAPGYECSNLLFKPMVCTEEEWAVSQRFVPYCPTMADLYEMIKALQG